MDLIPDFYEFLIDEICKKLRIFIIHTEEVIQYVFEEHEVDYNQKQQPVERYLFSIFTKKIHFLFKIFRRFTGNGGSDFVELTSGRNFGLIGISSVVPEEKSIKNDKVFKKK